MDRTLYLTSPQKVPAGAIKHLLDAAESIIEK